MQKRGINQIHDITIRHVNGKEIFKKCHTITTCFYICHLIIIDWHQHKDITMSLISGCKEKHHHPALGKKNQIEKKKRTNEMHVDIMRKEKETFSDSIILVFRT